MTLDRVTEAPEKAGEPSSNIYIVGFMGTGKSSVGLRLAEKLGWDFCDLDAEIEKASGETISEIFRNHGEARFRKIESEMLRYVSARNRTVVALGGGAFCSEENRRVTAGSGTSVWLDAPLELIMARCIESGSRPLFGDLATMAALLEARRPAYQMAALRIEVEGLTAEEIAERIVELVPAGS